MEIIQDIDFNILFYIQFLHNPFLDKIMAFITNIGNLGAIWFAIAIVLIAIKKYRKYGFLMLVAILITCVIGSCFLKPLTARPRPFTFYPEVEILVSKPKSFSFPSGHTFIAFASAVVLTYMNYKVGIAAFVLAIAIAFSRLYFFVHFPSDVLAGALLGTIVALIVVYFYSLIQKMCKPKRRRAK